MAWKLRKDIPQTDALPENTSLADTAIPEEDIHGLEAEQTQPLEFAPEPQPFALAETETETAMPLEEPLLSPLAWDSEPMADMSALSLSGPFVPFQMDDPAPPDAAEPDFSTSPHQEEIAPSLVHSDLERDVPRVAPFIVDVPPPADDVPAVAGMLIVRIGSFAATFALTEDVSVIGRPDSVLQSYPDVEIELDDAVSRRHAEIRHRDGGYVLVDLQSTNGTLLNGQRLEGDREYPLAHGDRIHVGDRTEIIFE